ncbi:hypothetical protein ACFO5K_00790 [Nocardia halotolerans]|uniref:DUF732 domain-containing protein n=1 Tax=Nocardia halotolerans TaxID=1755878 RepID=A0ABV8VB06_9NOCA
MRRTTAAIAAGTTVFVLFLSGCGEDTSVAADPTSTTPAVQVDPGKAAMFVVSYRNAFPKLAQDRDDAAVRGVLDHTCSDVAAGVSEADTVAGVVRRTENGATTATQEEAQAIYEMAELMC